VGFGGFASISADGRIVAFEIGDLFVHDRTTRRTERASVDYEINGAALADLSSDGHIVAFAAQPPGDSPPYSVFVRDRTAGTTELVSGGLDPSEPYDTSSGPALWADGSVVALASNFGSVADTGDVFIHDRPTGRTQRLRTRTNFFYGFPDLSADGQLVGFPSLSPDLVPGDTNDRLDVFVHDRTSGSTERASVSSDGNEGNGFSAEPELLG
jgi:hypothetical protein